MDLVWFVVGVLVLFVALFRLVIAFFLVSFMKRMDEGAALRRSAGAGALGLRICFGCCEGAGVWVSSDWRR